jgi:hypothetical protein
MYIARPIFRTRRLPTNRAPAIEPSPPAAPIRPKVAAVPCSTFSTSSGFATVKTAKLTAFVSAKPMMEIQSQFTENV